MPTSDPLFSTMVSQVASGNVKGAAATAAGSKYFAQYLARRLALQMQNTALDATAATDNDATAFLIAHFTGSATKASISTIWSDNSTYLVNITSNGTTTATHAASVTAAQLAALDWTTALTSVAGQTANTLTTAAGKTTAAPTPIPAKDSGGYATLSDRIADQSFIMNAATSGTNLRIIEGIWEISTGLGLLDVASTANVVPQNVPRFVPEYDPNFFHGSGQPACIACHGGGMSSLNHGYSTVADKYNFDPQFGLVYFATPTTATMKSLASDPTKRATNATCNLVSTPTAVCNPDSVGADPNQAWDLTGNWESAGVLNTMGWTGAKTGQGLNSLGTALGQATIVYQFLVKRVIGEICPLGMFTQTDVNSIAAAANPFAQPAGTDDIRTIVAAVAANATCQ